ncbi:MAG: hypothetical protein KDK70_08515, partial [Myxococcales bacterium]|nr:hypothetical protein [Myxococcales bacterium]
MGSVVAAAGFSLLALAHSALGERTLLRPLFARPWELGLPRPVAERILRFAWHLTSLAWLGLAALALGASPEAVLSLVALISGVVVFLALRGHLAWPILLVIALASGRAGGWVGAGLLGAVASCAALGLL